MTKIEGWPEWGQYVMAKLEKIEGELHKNTIELTKLKVKAGIWGLVGSLVSLGIFAGVSFLV